MKRQISAGVLAFFSTIAMAQERSLKDLSNEASANYILASIYKMEQVSYPLFKGTLFLNIYVMHDSNSTPAGTFDGYDGVLSSILISIAPDGDYYSVSKLYKIEGLLDPKVIAIKEGNDLSFTISVESGSKEQRETETFIMDGKKLE